MLYPCHGSMVNVASCSRSASNLGGANDGHEWARICLESRPSQERLAAKMCAPKSDLSAHMQNPATRRQGVGQIANPRNRRGPMRLLTEPL